jgi:multicomponent Na+:H+ antiporter subunit A
MDPHLLVVLAAVFLPFVGAVLVPPLHRVLGEAVGYVGALVAGGSFALILSQVGRTGPVSVPWIPSMEIALRFQVDGLGLLFALLASGIGVLIFTYSTEYMHGEENLGQFYMALLAFLGSILGVALAADLIALFLFWELTSVCSFILIGYHTSDGESQYSARMAMLITVGGGLCLLVAAILLAIAAEAAGIETFNLAAMLDNPGAVEAELRERGLFVPTILFVTVAAAAKSAQVPLYFWLPRAMVAPTPVSAFLHSATMVKVGVYALGRLRPLFHSIEWLVVVATLGLLTMTVGAILAVRARDIKELLAYSTVSHLGLMVAGFGFQTHYGPEAGAFHLLNHALFKAALFLVAGIIAHEVGTRNVDDLGGLWRDLPVTAGVTGVAALSMAGLPPFNGFYSKEILFEAAWETAQAHGGASWLFPATAVFGSIFTVLYSLRFLWLFLGDKPEALGSVPRPSPWLVAPPVVLAVGVAVVSLAPDLATGFIVDDAASASAVESVTIDAKIPTSLSGPVGMSIVTVATGIALFPRYGRVRRGLDSVHQTTVHAHPPRLYNDLLSGTETTSDSLTAFVHNGLIRTYVWWTLLAACTLVLGGYATTAVGLPTPLVLETPVAMALVLAVAVLAAVAVTTAESHVSAVLTLGILGFMVAVFYILASGPDLALTQLVVETLLLLIFLLALEELPAFYGDIDLQVAARDAVLSVVVGATAFVSVLLAQPSGDGDLSKTAQYYVDNAVKEGGGGNVVNVILTDFRAFDTLGESIVIVLAAVSVLVLITMRNRGEQQ